MVFKEFIAAANPYNISCADIGNCANKTQTIGQGLSNIAQLLTGVIGMLAVVFIIVGGLQMSLSRGDPKRYQQGRQTLEFSIIGVVLAIVAFAVVKFVAGGL